MHRSEYMADSGSHSAFRAYYGQYVTPAVKQLVMRTIGMKALRGSEDPHMNDIPLRRWDAMVGCLPNGVAAALKASGDWLSLGTGVCILKEAARQILESDET